MAIDPIQSVSNNSAAFDPTQATSLNNNQITAMLLNKSIDPKFATILLQQMNQNNIDSILFGEDINNPESSSAGIDIFGMQGMIPSNLQGTNTVNNTDIFGASAFSSISPQFEMSVYSTLIGKTVSATDPLNGQRLEGKVTSVQLQNGQIMVEINDRFIPTNNLTGIEQGG